MIYINKMSRRKIRPTQSPIVNIRVERMNLATILPSVIEIAVEAGKRILVVYASDFDVETKTDGSPLTRADMASHEHIVAQLAILDPSIPILSEESKDIEYGQRKNWRKFWLVDPLDGTKEFVKRNGEFTVNIALIEDGKPVLGVVYVPVTGVTYAAAKGVGATHIDAEGLTRQIAVTDYRGGKAIVVGSRSHAGPKLQEFVRRLEAEEGSVSNKSMGSSLKLCLVAEGKADIYPRFGPTSEWDTAAAQCVVEVAGGKVVDMQGNMLGYNKESILNPWFVVMGKDSYGWQALWTDL